MLSAGTKRTASGTKRTGGRRFRLLLFWENPRKPVVSALLNEWHGPRYGERMIHDPQINPRGTATKAWSAPVKTLKHEASPRSVGVGDPELAVEPTRVECGSPRPKAIVCGTDFSIHAREAAEVAAGISRRSDSPLVVAHAVDTAGSPAASETLAAMLRYRGRNKLKEETERLRARGVEVQAEFLTGNPAAEVVKCAFRHEAGLIVVSSLGQLHPGRWLIGSVAEQIAQTSPTPVLVVRNPRPFMDWLTKRKALKVVIGHDFSASADAAVAWVAALKKIAPCRITIAHFSLTQVAPDWLEVGTQPGRKRTVVETRGLLAEALSRRCKALLGTARFDLQVRSIRASTASRLVILAKQQNADLIVVGTNQKGTLRRLCLGSVSRSVLREAGSSVACVPIRGIPKAPAGVPHGNATTQRRKTPK